MSKQKTSILVTGGAGNIGTNLCKELFSRGHKVFSIDLYNTERENYIRCDLRNYRQLQYVFDEFGSFDYVYHLAAEYGRWNGEAYYENLWQTNTIGTKHILRLQEKLKFRLIFFSSAEVYGDYDGFMKEDALLFIEHLIYDKQFNANQMLDVLRKPYSFEEKSDKYYHHPEEVFNRKWCEDNSIN